MRPSNERRFGSPARDPRWAFRFVSTKSDLADRAKSQLIVCESLSLTSFKSHQENLLSESQQVQQQQQQHQLLDEDDDEDWRTNLDEWKQKRRCVLTTTTNKPPLHFEFESVEVEQNQQTSKTCCKSNCNPNDDVHRWLAQNEKDNVENGQTSILTVPLPVINSNLPTLKSSIKATSQPNRNNSKQQETKESQVSTVVVDQTPKRKLSGEQVMQKAALFEKLSFNNTAANLSVDKSPVKTSSSRLHFVNVETPLNEVKNNNYCAERKVSFFSKSLDDVIDSGVDTNRESSISPSRDSRESSSPRSHSSSESGDHAPVPARRKIKVYAPPEPLEIDDNKWKYQRKIVQKSFQEFKVCIELNVEARERGFGFTLKGGKEKRESLAIETVIKGSGADKAGIKIGDVLLEIDGEDVSENYLTKVNPVVREAMKVGVIELRLRRSYNPFPNGGYSPASPKADQLSPSAQSSFSERRSIFEKQKPEHQPRSAKNRRHSAHTNANCDSTTNDRRKLRHRSVDDGSDRHSKPAEICGPQTAKLNGSQTKPYYTNSVTAPMQKSVNFRRPDENLPVDLDEKMPSSMLSPSRDYRVTSMHEEKSVGRILDFVPESERTARSLHEFSNKNVNYSTPQPFVLKHNEQEDFQWRRERERVMAKAGPAATKPIKPATLNVKRDEFITAVAQNDSAVVVVNGLDSKPANTCKIGIGKTIPSNSVDSKQVSWCAGKNASSQYSNSLKSSTLSSPVQVQQRKSPEEAAKTLEKWLTPKIASDQEPPHQECSPPWTAQNNPMFVRKMDHEMGVTSVKRYEDKRSPVTPGDNVVRKISIPNTTSHIDSTPKPFLVDNNNIVRRINSTRRVRCRLQEAKENFYGLQKSSSQHINVNHSSSNISTECRCCGKGNKNDANPIRHEKPKQFTYQITVQDPRKSIARPVPVRQERSILILQIRPENMESLCKMRKHQTHLQAVYNSAAPLYRVERSQSSAVMSDAINNATLENRPAHLKPAINPMYNKNEGAQERLTKPTVNGHNLQKSASDYTMNNGLRVATVPVSNGFKTPSNNTNQYGSSSSINQRKLSLEQQIDVVETLASRAIGETTKMRPPSPKYPTLSQNQNGDLDEQKIAVSDRQLCSHCSSELGRGAAMTIESLNMFFHVPCFKCFVCETPLGDGTQGADVRVRAGKLHCHKCYDGLRCSAV